MKYLKKKQKKNNNASFKKFKKLKTITPAALYPWFLPYNTEG